MAKRGKRPTLEERLDRLSDLRDEPDGELVGRELRRALQGRQSLLVARAARLSADLGHLELVPEMVAAFDRFLVDPVKTDKGCLAKTAIARALVELEERPEELYFRGARHVQPEPAYGGPVDAAAELRGVCAHGLASTGHPDAVLELVRLLADPEWRVRAEAARALGNSGRLEAEAVLRLKALVGDTESEVVCECLGSLLSIAPERSLDFVTGFLASRDQALVEGAALALGESRLEGAVEALKEAYGRCLDGEVRRTLLLAVAMTRREAGFDFLVSLVGEGRPARAAEAIEALAIHRHDGRVRERMRAAVGRRGDAELRSLFDREF